MVELVVLSNSRLGEDSSEFVILRQPLSDASRVTISYIALLAALIMVGMVVMSAGR